MDFGSHNGSRKRSRDGLVRPCDFSKKETEADPREAVYHHTAAVTDTGPGLWDPDPSPPCSVLLPAQPQLGGSSEGAEGGVHWLLSKHWT